MNELEFELAQQIRDQFPDNVLKETLVDVAKKKLKDYEVHIEKKRHEYNKLTSFTEKSDYYDNILKVREEGYRLAKAKLEHFIANPHPKPYEMWVTKSVHEYMTTIGYKEYLTRFYTLII